MGKLQVLNVYRVAKIVGGRVIRTCPREFISRHEADAYAQTSALLSGEPHKVTCVTCREIGHG